MRKKSNKSEIKVIHTTSIDELKLNCKMIYPFHTELINLLKSANKFEQEYYYIENDKDYAFFILYKNKMNIFTFGKLKCYINLKVIGYPCSLSNPGYITSNENFMLNFIKTIKGAKLILNVIDVKEKDEFTIGQTLPTCIFENSFNSIEEYLSTLRSGYRRRINIAIKNCEELKIKEINDNSIDVYNLYLNTYNKSNYKLEKLEREFFEKVDAQKLVFIKENSPIGFVLLKQDGERLIFMLCGMDYNYETTDLYYYMLFKIVEYAIVNKCKSIDLGQTSEETKMKFGALLEQRYFYAHHTNPIINLMVKMGKNILEYNYKFPRYRVFKEGIR